MSTEAPIWGLPPDLVRDDMVFSLAPKLWHLPADVWEPLWQKADGTGMTIAILDTGFTSHPDLPEPVQSRSFIRGESINDGNGHGTHCAGTSLGRKGLGVAPGAKLIVGKVLSNGGSGYSQGIAEGVAWAADAGADVISMSLGGGSAYKPTLDAIDYAWSKGCIVNAAAGNSGFSGRNTVGWPAKYDSCICTGATRSDGSIADFSSGGDELDWACPGQNIISASTSRGYVSMSGTSMATPFGSGLLAIIKHLLLREGRPQWKSIGDFRAFIQRFVEDRGAKGKDPRFGYGYPLYAQIVHTLAEGDISWI